MGAGLAPTPFLPLPYLRRRLFPHLFVFSLSQQFTADVERIGVARETVSVSLRVSRGGGTWAGVWGVS